MTRAPLLAALLLLAGCGDAPQGGEPVVRIALDGGSEDGGAASPSASSSAAAFDACEVITFEKQRFVDCIADPADHTIATALSPSGGAPFRSFAAFRKANPQADVAFAMNGGMFDDAGMPVGYFVENGERLKELSRANGVGNFHLKPNGVFFGSGSTWQVLDTEEFYSTVLERPQFGTQSGPMLVIDGEIHPEITENGPSRLLRNAVGVDGQGRAHFVISQGPISFGVIARLYRDRLKTPNALFLDGSVSSLWDPVADRMDQRAPLGPLIVVKNKARAQP
ncbi:phosphodiester glycosidase family protein [Aurantiacibacter flavus]|uniref:Phosphodiester glycosidase family protein n=1 Tax=Aurantiacibacter flavus TaxID=3145232 RepID=A0ABV0CZH3_9SPHN